MATVGNMGLIIVGLILFVSRNVRSASAMVIAKTTVLTPVEQGPFHACQTALSAIMRANVDLMAWTTAA